MIRAASIPDHDEDGCLGRVYSDPYWDWVFEQILYTDPYWGSDGQNQSGWSPTQMTMWSVLYRCTTQLVIVTDDNVKCIIQVCSTISHCNRWWCTCLYAVTKMAIFTCWRLSRSLSDVCACQGLVSHIELIRNDLPIALQAKTSYIYSLSKMTMESISKLYSCCIACLAHCLQEVCN